MEQRWRRKDAALRDVTNMPKREEFVSLMAPRRRVNNVALRDVPILSEWVEFVGRTAQDCNDAPTTCIQKEAW